jgi:glycine oxidase
VRIVIVGAGVMGCASALELARRGVRDIVVLERAVPGAEASSAAAGMLAAQVESKDAAERASFVAARDGYAAWANELREAVGLDIGYRRSGVLELGETDDDVAKLSERVADDRAAGLRAELLDAAGARAIERELGPEHRVAAYFPDEAQVDPPQLLRALVAAIARAGVSVKSGATVTSILEQGDRCAGVALDGSETLRADAVILAAGSWSSLVPGVPKALPAVRPVRGQLLMLEERPPRLSTIVFLGGGYVVPRGDGRVVCGSTMEHVGHRREVTAAGVQAILAQALRIAPALGAAELSRAWCNFRPHAEGGPQVGPSPLPGLFLATGHHRNGILLAKTTASTVSDAVLGAAPTKS